MTQEAADRGLRRRHDIIQRRMVLVETWVIALLEGRIDTNEFEARVFNEMEIVWLDGAIWGLSDAATKAQTRRKA